MRRLSVAHVFLPAVAIATALQLRAVSTANTAAPVVEKVTASAAVAEPVKSQPHSVPVAEALSAYLIANIDRAAEAGDGKAAAAADSESNALFINKFVGLMRHDAKVIRRTGNTPQARATAARRQNKSLPMTATQRQQVQRRVAQIVEERGVSLVIATRLVKRSWSPSMDNNNSRNVQQFIRLSLKAWIVDEIRAEAVPPADARAILSNAAFLLRGESVAIVGGLAEAAVTDLDSIHHPDALISLMWSVHVTDARAPPQFWAAVLDRLLHLNNNLRGKMMGIMDEAEAPSAATGRRGSRREVGHVFSGLTTRQIYRLLEVLKRERWNGGAGALRDLADQALKNIVFEAEAASFEPTTATAVFGGGDGGAPVAVAPLSRQEVEQRMKLIADLDMEEFIGLLSISGDFGIPFSISAARVSDHILAPMVGYLDSTQLLEVMQVARGTRCNSASLMNVLAAKIETRGPDAPYALPLTKAFARTILKETELFPHVNLTGFVAFFLRVCNEQAAKVRGEELCGLAEVLYSLSRRFAPSSSVGHDLRATMDLLCRQVNRLLQLELAPPSHASRLLEHTIVLGMRASPELYPSVPDLLVSRNVAVGQGRERRGRSAERAVELSATSATTTAPGGNLGPRWEDQPESELPRLSKAALSVYTELIYMFERMAVVKASLGQADFRRFEAALNRAGVFNLLVGANLMKLGHLEGIAPHSNESLGGQRQPRDTLAVPLDVLPGWMEKTVCQSVVRRIRSAVLTTASANDDVLRVLGQVHCDAAKVHECIRLVLDSPLRMLQNQRDLWGYLVELARRFGCKEDRRVAQDHFDKALF